MWLLYWLVFGVSNDGHWLQAASDAVCNTLPVGLLAIAVRAVLKAEVMRRPSWLQAVWHGGLAIGFAFVWYATLTLLLAVAGDLAGRGFHPVAFRDGALVWQIFQGLLVYASIAAVCYAIRGGREAAPVTIVTPSPALPPLTRYLIRTDEDLTPIDVDDIVSITGAQDYSEVATGTGCHLVRLSLNEFEARLDPSRFVRVHRSAIINIHRLVRFEPAGSGRLLAHMETGQVVAVSRSGVLALRRFTV